MLKSTPTFLLLGLLLGFGAAACGDDPKPPAQCVQPEGSCPNICDAGIGVLGESCDSPSDCQCGLFCSQGQCAPYEGEHAGCFCAGGVTPEFPAPPATVTRCTDDTVGAPCEDDNPCTTTGVCTDSNQCDAPPITYAAACDDGNACTSRDTCAGAVCVGITRDDGSICEDGDLCSGQDTCIQGACVPGTPPDCSPLSDGCNAGVCDPDTGACVAVAVADGTACDDSDACTDADSCEAGACKGEARSCAGLGDTCSPAACNPDTGLCETAPAEDGLPCDDGDRCSLEDACQAGACAPGPQVFCDDPCLLDAACNPETGRCEGPPAPDGTACDDANACTLTDACLGGRCEGQMDTCFCEGKPSGTACDDFNPCTQVDACQGDACVGSSPLDCDDLSDACNVGFCDPDTGACTTTPVLPGTPCDDGSRCTEADACFNGACRGTPKACAGLAAACEVGSCDPDSGECVTAPALDGVACNNGDSCVIGEQCAAGVCVGGQNQCSACEALPPGSACDDGDPCTLGDTCTLDSGVKVCVGQPLDCSDLDQGCTIGRCDPDTVTCVEAPALDGLACDDLNDCTERDACASGACLGQPFPACEGAPAFCEPYVAIDNASVAQPLALVDGALIVRGRVDQPGESDWYSVDLERGKRFSMITGPDCGSQLDTFISIRRADGQTVLASNDDAASPWAALTELEIPRTERYFLQVRSFASSGASSYLLRLLLQEPPSCTTSEECGCDLLSCDGDAENPGRCVAPFPPEAEPNNAPDAATPLALGDQVSGELEDPTDADWFALPLEAGVPVNVATDTFCANPVDTELHLYDVDGATRLLFNDDTAGNITSSLSAFTPEQTGIYFLQVLGHDFATGPYRLRAEDARCAQDADCGCADLVCDLAGARACVPHTLEVEPNGTLPQATPLSPGGRVTGRIAAPRESDVFALILPPGSYTFETEGLCGAGGDTLLQLLSPQGEVIAEDDDSGAGRFSRVQRQLSTAGTYYVRVTFYGVTQGDYVLSVQ